MAAVRVRGCGGNVRNTTFVDDLDPQLRVRGWGGSRQWKMHAVYASTRIRGWASGQQWKLWIYPPIEEPL